MESQIIEQDFALLEQIKIAAWSEIPVNPYSPVYKLFQDRQECAMQFFQCDSYSEISTEQLKISFKRCNEQIKKYLGL